MTTVNHGKPYEPDELREAAVVRSKHIVVRLADELDEMIKACSHMREAFQNELMDGMGYKRLGIPDKLVKKGKELATMMDVLVSAKIRFDKAAKTMADNMTPDEEKRAVMTFLKALPAEECNEMLKNFQGWRDMRREDIAAHARSIRP